MLQSLTALVFLKNIHQISLAKPTRGGIPLHGFFLTNLVVLQTRFLSKRTRFTGMPTKALRVEAQMEEEEKKKAPYCFSSRSGLECSI